MNETAASQSYINMSMHLILSNMPLAHLDADSQATNNYVIGQKAQGWALENEIYVNHDFHPNYSI